MDMTGEIVTFALDPKTSLGFKTDKIAGIRHYKHTHMLKASEDKLQYQPDGSKAWKDVKGDLFRFKGGALALDSTSLPMPAAASLSDSETVYPNRINYDDQDLWAAVFSPSPSHQHYELMYPTSLQLSPMEPSSWLIPFKRVPTKANGKSRTTNLSRCAVFMFFCAQSERKLMSQLYLSSP